MIVALRGEIRCLDEARSYDLTSTRHVGLAREFISAFGEVWSGIISSSAYTHEHGCRVFLDWLDDESVRAVGTAADLPLGSLDRFESYCRTIYDSSAATVVASIVKRYVREISAYEIAPVPDPLLEEATGLDGRWVVDEPWEPYTASELHRIRVACVQQIRYALGAIREGDRLVRSGRGGLADAVRRMREQGPVSRGAYRARYGLWASDVPWTPVLERVGPTNMTGHAIAALLTLGSGFEATVPFGLRVDQITDRGDGTALLSYDKPRTLKPQEDVFRSRGITGLIGLKRIAITMTRHIRPFAREEDAAVLLLVIRHTSTEAGSVRPISQSYRRHQGGLASLVKKYDLKDDDGEKLVVLRSRLRKNFWDASYRQNPFSLKNAVRGRKTIDVGDEHYFKTKSLRRTHEDSIRRGIRSAFDVQPEGVSGLEESCVAQCRNPLASPFSPPGERCADPLLGCFFCGNAIFTRSKLPAVLSLADEATNQRRLLPVVEWERKWGPIWHQIQHGILPEFTVEEVEEAARLVGSDGGGVFLPHQVRNVKAR